MILLDDRLGGGRADPGWFSTDPCSPRAKEVDAFHINRDVDFWPDDLEVKREGGADDAFVGQILGEWEPG
jgi:hypothetical protein